jgi:hypothetical protein
MNLQAFSFTVGFQNGSFDKPYQGRENLNVFPYSGDFSPASPFQTPFASVVLQPSWQQPYTQNWNATFERSFGSWLATVRYIGTKATHLVGNANLNAPIYHYALSLSANQSSINARPLRQQFQSITTIFTGLNSIYNGLQLSTRKRFSHGFTVQPNYTWSRAIDELSKNAQVTGDNVQNPFKWRMARGPADFDRTHLFTASYVGTCRGRKSKLGLVLANWQWSGLISAATDTPFGINSTNDAMAGAGTVRGGHWRYQSSQRAQPGRADRAMVQHRGDHSGSEWNLRIAGTQRAPQPWDVELRYPRLTRLPAEIQGIGESSIPVRGIQRTEPPATGSTGQPARPLHVRRDHVGRWKPRPPVRTQTRLLAARGIIETGGPPGHAHLRSGIRYRTALHVIQP